MRTHNELERLAAARQSLLPDVEATLVANEEDRILERILASPRVPVVARRRGPLMLVAAAASAAAAAIATFALSGGRMPGTAPRVAHQRAATFALASYKFRLPAGYTASTDPCSSAQFWGGLHGHQGAPAPVPDSSAAAASADGGCLLASLIGGDTTLPANATAVTLGPYAGFVAVAPAGSQKALFVEIPDAAGNHYLLLMSQALTTQQLITVAESGLPAGVPRPGQACATNCG
jgi:hypothetical protein